MEEYKISVLGETGTGAKTSLIHQLIYNEFIENCIISNGTNYSTIFIQVNLGIIKLGLWDLVGHIKYIRLNKNLFKDSHCIILGYDITDKRSFNEIKEYHYNTVRDFGSNDSLIYLVANKIDLFLQDEVSEEEVIDNSREKGIKYFRVTACTGEGVNELFEDIVNSLIIKFKKVIDNNDKNFNKRNNKR